MGETLEQHFMNNIIGLNSASNALRLIGGGGNGAVGGMSVPSGGSDT